MNLWFLWFGNLGKYIPSIATRIDKGNNDPNRKLTINLQGIAIGDGWTNPLIQTASYIPFAYNTG